MAPSIVLSTVFAYITLLFILARWGDQQQFVERSWVRHPLVYALALGVYCTSWTFYGLVGTASEKGWNFLPILLGPLLLFTLGYPILRRIYRISQQEHIHSIADFIASRYGKRQGVAATVSLVVVLATIPYIALQLKAVSDTLLLTVGKEFLANQDLTFVVALSMIAFAFLFGARRLDVSGYHSGLMSVIAFESIVKIVVLLLIAGFSLSILLNSGELIKSAGSLTSLSPTDNHLPNAVLLNSPSWLRFFIETLLSACAIFCLPRMFHITFVECLTEQHLKKSRWCFSTYLLLISACVFIIAWVGNIAFYDDISVSADAYMIALPLQAQQPWLALITFLGGFSAATAMIIVATITLSQMLSNDVFLPLLVRHRKKNNQAAEFSRSLIIARRIVVVLVVMAAYFYQSILAENVALTSIGLIAFALVVQLAPGILLGLFWRKGNARGLYAGLFVGLFLWFYILLIPLLCKAGLIGNGWVDEGFLDIFWLRPESFLGFDFGDAFSRGVIISLLANIIFYCWYSIGVSESLSDRIQAAAFSGLRNTVYESYDDVDLNDLYALLVEFVGEDSSHLLFSAYRENSTLASKRYLLEEVQKILAGTVGVASAQAMIASVRTGKKMAVEEVVSLFGETTKALRFNQEILFASFENVSSAISVVDKYLRLVAWNSHYQRLFSYPESMLRIGLHVADIMRHNGERGLLGHGDIDDLIRKRLALMASGKAYRVIRHYNNDNIIEIKGRPLPNGGYVTTYDDITEFILAQRQLEEANHSLEARVLERTQTIEAINKNLLNEIERRSQVEDELRRAKKIADDANASKSTFMALAGHDILQPLNAANLYASSILDSDNYNPLVMQQLKHAIQNTESIISSLLEISRLDMGGMVPKRDVFSLHDLLQGLVNDAVLLQSESDLTLRYRPTSVVVFSDKHYLRRILQNFITNAIKYTRSGKVLVGCRRHYRHEKPYVTICVIDNGPGISDHECEIIFNDFYRCDRQDQHGIPGVGLGLSVVKRFGELLHHPVRCRSIVASGSCFSVDVPMADADTIKQLSHADTLAFDHLHNLRIAYVDDDMHNLLATSALLSHWQCQVVLLENVQAARDYARAIKNKSDLPDVLLMDYQLGDTQVDGLLLAEELVGSWQQRFIASMPVPVCIVSAATGDELPQKVEHLGFNFLSKPVKPARLRALLTQIAQHK